MTLKELGAVLETTGIHFAYHHWESPPSLPYGVFLDPYSNNFIADNRVYESISHIQIELYAESRDLTAEEAIETTLNNNELPFEKSCEYLSEQRLYETIYEIEV